MSTGLTPNMVMLGREVKLPVEIMYGGKISPFIARSCPNTYVEALREQLQNAHSCTRNHLNRAAKLQKEMYDVKIVLNNYKVGDVVWYLDESRYPEISPKLQSLERGPCVIIEKKNELNYTIHMTEKGKMKTVHHNKLKPYLGENVPAWIKKVLRK